MAGAQRRGELSLFILTLIKISWVQHHMGPGVVAAGCGGPLEQEVPRIKAQHTGLFYTNIAGTIYRPIIHSLPCYM